MTRVVVCSALIVAASLVALLILGCSRSGRSIGAGPDTSETLRVEQAVKTIAVQQDEVLTSLAELMRSFCRQRCEESYFACVGHVMQVSILEGIPGRGGRAPGKELPPGCWPYDCEPEEAEVVPGEGGDPIVSCGTHRDACLEECG